MENKDIADDFSPNHKKQIQETSLKLKGITGHPAYPFLIKTFMEIISRPEVNGSVPVAYNCDTGLAVVCNKSSYTVNLLTAFNYRVDNIIRETQH